MNVTLPLTTEDAASLKAGQHVLLSGPIFTARDATHKRILIEVDELGHLPYNLQGQTLFYAGPTPEAGGRPLGSVGPTTSKRMDFATEAVLKAGITATLGKGPRSPEAARAHTENGAIYFGAVGGIAAVLASAVSSAEVVAYSDLGPEALMKLNLVNFPAFVALDLEGNDYYEDAPRAWRESAGFAEPTPVVSPAQTSHEGIFITFEGGDGAGKSTQSIALCRQLEMRGYDVVSIREPGGTLIGEKVREILLDCDHGEMCPTAELFLYEAARAQLVQQIIKPALEAGKVVICDRFFDSTTAYQGYGRGLDIDMINTLNLAASDQIIPNRTIVLCTEAEQGLKRASRHTKPDRLESEIGDFHERVVEGFKKIAKADPERVRIISSDKGITDVFCEILENINDLFPEAELTCDDAEAQHRASNLPQNVVEVLEDAK